MRLDPWTLAAIAGMALVTFACRAGGWWVFRRVRPSPLVRAVSGYLPGTLFMAYVTPPLLDGGPQQWTGAAVAVGVMLGTRNLGLATILGTAAAWGVWQFG